MQLRENPFARVLWPSLVLALFYWGLYGRAPSISVQPDGSEKGMPGKASLAPEESRRLLDLSTTLKRQGKHEEALVPTLTLHESYPENHIYIESLATLCNRLGRYKEEAQYWEMFLQQAPIPIEGCPQIGQAYEKQGRAKEAIGAFERCLDLDPRNLDSLFFLAHSLEMSQQFDRAAELYGRAAAIDPAYLDLRVGLARVRLHQGQYAQAKEVAGKVLVQSPSNVDAMLVLGLASWREGNNTQAKGYLQDGVRLAEKYTDFYVALGSIAEEENDIPQAIKNYTRVLELDPSNRDIALRRSTLARGN